MLRELSSETRGASSIEQICAIVLVALLAVAGYASLGAGVRAQVECAAAALGGHTSDAPTCTRVDTDGHDPIVESVDGRALALDSAPVWSASELGPLSDV